MHFGSSVESDIKAQTEKAKTTKAARSKAQQVLNKWLADQDAPGRYADPAARRE